MWPRSKGVVLSAILLVGTVLIMSRTGAVAGGAATHTVQGQNDIAVDRPAIQAAIDAAGHNDTVELVGTFQLDGQRIFIQKSHLTLEGRAVDDDGDGRINEDWIDAADNDGDGQIDEDPWNAVLVGLAYADGSPVQDSFEYPEFTNRAIGVSGIYGRVSRITIRNIRFTTLNRGIIVFPDTDSSSHLCDEIFVTGGWADHVTLEKNRFDNVVRGFQIWGNVESFVADGNLINNVVRYLDGGSGIGILVYGEGVGCRASDGTDSAIYGIGTPRNGEIAGNRLLDSEIGLPLTVTEGENVRVVLNEVRFTDFWGIRVGGRNNFVFQNLVAGPYARGIYTWGYANTVLHNTVSGANRGLQGAYDSNGSQFSNNIVRDAYIGLNLLGGAPDGDARAAGYMARNNQFENSEYVDIWLREGSHDNTIISNDWVTTVTDDGVDNKLVGTLAMISNPGLPDDVRDHLEDIRAKQAARFQQ